MAMSNDFGAGRSEQTLADLLDPIALEARLVEARARRAVALAAKARLASSPAETVPALAAPASWRPRRPARPRPFGRLIGLPALLAAMGAASLAVVALSQGRPSRPIGGPLAPDTATAAATAIVASVTDADKSEMLPVPPAETAGSDLPDPRLDLAGRPASLLRPEARPAAPTAATTLVVQDLLDPAPVPAASSPDGTDQPIWMRSKDADLSDGTSGTVQADAPADPARPATTVPTSKPGTPSVAAPSAHQSGVPAGQGDARTTADHARPGTGHPRGDGRTGRTSAHAGHGRGAVTAPRAAEHGARAQDPGHGGGRAPGHGGGQGRGKDQARAAHGGPGAAAARSGGGHGAPGHGGPSRDNPSRGNASRGDAPKGGGRH
ncbi:MAG: hypothetical protein U1E34_09620 [Amaricoccus sp.]